MGTQGNGEPSRASAREARPPHTRPQQHVLVVGRHPPTLLRLQRLFAHALGDDTRLTTHTGSVDAIALWDGPRPALVVYDFTGDPDPRTTMRLLAAAFGARVVAASPAIAEPPDPGTGRAIGDRALPSRLLDHVDSLSGGARASLAQARRALADVLREEHPGDEHARIALGRALRALTRAEHAVLCTADLIESDTHSDPPTTAPIRLDRLVYAAHAAAQERWATARLFTEPAAPIMVHADPSALPRLVTDLLAVAHDEADLARGVAMRLGAVGDDAVLELVYTRDPRRRVTGATPALLHHADMLARRMDGTLHAFGDEDSITLHLRLPRYIAAADEPMQPLVDPADMTAHWVDALVGAEASVTNRG